MLDSLSNIFKITELRNKILYTLMMFAIFRAGIHIPVPGVDASVIESLFTSGNLFGLLDLFAGGALSKFSIFAMSITPYINASIIMQLLQSVVPQFEAWSKDDGSIDIRCNTHRKDRELLSAPPANKSNRPNRLPDVNKDSITDASTPGTGM